MTRAPNLNRGEARASGLAPAIAASRWLTAEALAETLRTLVAIESVNPGFNGAAGGEAKVQGIVAELLARKGMTARFETVSPDRPNLRVRLDGANPDASPLVFQTHIDTVSIEGMTIDPLGGAVRDGRLWGRGATDAKGQATAMLHALLAWAEAGKKPPRSIELALCVDEEHGFGGARALVDKGLDAAGIVIGEPTNLRLVVAHKGSTRVWLEVHGRGCHASQPLNGINAIEHAAALVDRMRREYIPELARRAEGLLRAATVNIAEIRGGIQANLVPPSCRIHLERRTLPGESGESFLAELREQIDKAARDCPGLEVTIEPPTFDAPAFATDPRSGLARALGAIGRGMGLNPTPIGVDYATDACELRRAGAPIVIVGPGSIEQAHTADEFIEIDELTRGARFYAEAIGMPFEALEDEPTALTAGAPQ